jgi:hypothetical protein
MNIYKIEMKLTVHTADYVSKMDRFLGKVVRIPYSVPQVIADGVANLFSLIIIAKY